MAVKTAVAGASPAVVQTQPGEVLAVTPVFQMMSPTAHVPVDGAAAAQVILLVPNVTGSVGIETTPLSCTV